MLTRGLCLHKPRSSFILATVLTIFIQYFQAHIRYGELKKSSAKCLVGESPKRLLQMKLSNLYFLFGDNINKG
jgi:hypothetical protein